VGKSINIGLGLQEEFGSFSKLGNELHKKEPRPEFADTLAALRVAMAVKFDF